MERDIALLSDILRAARRIIEKTQNHNLESFRSDEDIQDIVIRQLGIIGEAANMLSQQFKKENLSIPWHDIIAVRNRVIHGYKQVDLSRIWKIVQTDIPLLLEFIAPIVEAAEE